MTVRIYAIREDSSFKPSKHTAWAMTGIKKIALCLAALFFASTLVALPSWAQTGSISGTVTSADTEPLPGANILIEGTQIGATADAEGQYEISGLDPGTYTVVATFVGYTEQTQEVNVEAGETVTADFELASSTMAMEEVVAIGYGEQERQDVTGAVSSVSPEEIAEVPVTDIGEALQGRVPGAVALDAGGRPGQGVTIRVRGRRSLTASNDPLYVIDGIPLEGGINAINPNDIESIEVLKDASATAIYGSRGANGVVLVTTSRGGDHGTIVSYSGRAGISEVLGTPDMMTGAEFAELKERAGRTFTPGEQEAIEQGVSTNWPDLLLENGHQQNHHLSVDGGNETTQFAVSGSYFGEGGVIPTQGFERTTVRLNLDHNISDRFRIGTSTQVSDQTQDWGSNPYGTALATNPLAEPYDEDGDLVFQPGADPLIFNPLIDLQGNAFIDERSRFRVFGNLFAEIDILDNLNYRVNFGPDYQDYTRGVFQASRTTARQGGEAYAEKNEEQHFTYTFENILSYEQDLGDIHSLNATGLFSIQESNHEWTDVAASGLPYENQLFHNIGSASTIENTGSRLEDWGLMSFMGRANYQLMDRYLLTVTGRYDGSSRLSDEKKWGFFPSIALGWRISEEPFMGDQNVFSNLRLRVSYGVAGNTSIDPYQTRGSLARTIYSFSSEPGYGYRPGQLANEDLQWETSATTNIGLDFGLWEDRLTGSIEVYQINTSNLLLERNIPITSGFNSVFQNIGETRNRGIEIGISSANFNGPEFIWTTDLVLGSNREEIVSLYGTGENDIGNQWFIGEPLTVWYDYDKVGIWQEDEAEEAASYDQEPGEIHVRDVNGDGMINEQDRVITGTDMPLVTASLSNSFSYKGFDLSFLLFGSFGHTIYNNFEVANSTMQGRYNNLDVDYWTPSNPTNEHPRADGSREFPLYSGSRGYMPGDFVKVRNIRLGYDVPSSLLENNLGLSTSMNIYLNVQTPFVFSPLEGGLDPEQYGGEITSDVPTTRLYTIGVDLLF